MNLQSAPPNCRDSAKLLRDFAESGFVILESAIRQNRLAEICVAYEEYMRPSSSSDLKAGSTTDRWYFNGEILLEDLCQQPLLVEICRQLINQPFKLKSILGRTVRTSSRAQDLHQDVVSDCQTHQSSFRKFLSFCASGFPSAYKALSTIFWTFSSIGGCVIGADTPFLESTAIPSLMHIGFPCCSCSDASPVSSLPGIQAWSAIHWS
jgi:hypothetical protein